VNDWHLEEWVYADPDRMVPYQLPCYLDLVPAPSSRRPTAADAAAILSAQRAGERNP
jgi:hypothetical protein